MRVKRGSGFATRKMLFSYVFILSSEREVAAIKKAVPSLKLNSPISTATGKRKYVTMPADEMAKIRKVADAFAGQLPCYRADAYSLDTCDRVRIIGGPLAGIEGAMAMTQGKRTGQVILPVNDLFVVSTGEVPPANYIVLEFGRGNRHPYHTFENYLPRALQAMEQRLLTGRLDTPMQAELLKFVTRYGELTARTLNIESTHAALMLLSYAALNDRAEAECWHARCREILPTLKAELQIALLLTTLYAATGSQDYAKRLQTLIATWPPIAAADRRKLLVTTTLKKFDRIYTSLKHLK